MRPVNLLFTACVVFGGAIPVSALDVRDFGATPNDATDDTAAIQMALDSAVTLGSDVEFPAGTYVTSAPIILQSGWRVSLRGIGDARIEWHGSDPSAAILVLADAYECEVENLELIAVTPAAVGLHLYNDPTTSVRNPHQCAIRFVRIEGVNGRIGKAVLIGGADAQNDFHKFDHCDFADYAIAGASLEASQAYSITFVDCQFKGYGFGDYGITTNLAGGNGIGGSFSVKGGLFSGHKQADISLGVPSPSPIIIEGINSEDSARLLVTRQSSASAWVILRGIRWVGQSLAADRQMISFNHGGTLSIESCNLNLYGPTDPLIQGRTNWAVPLKERRRILMRGTSIAASSNAIWSGIDPAVEVAELVGCFRTENIHTAFPLTLP